MNVIKVLTLISKDEFDDHLIKIKLINYSEKEV